MEIPKFFNPETKSGNYEIFNRPEVRREYFELSKRLAEYLQTEKIANLILIDRSARPAYVGVKEYWQAKFSEQTPPEIYFLNPEAFQRLEDDKLEQEMKKVYQQLSQEKDKPLAVFDACIHTGSHLYPIKKVLEQMNFSDVRFGACYPSPQGAAVETDFYLQEKSPAWGCHPFGWDRLVAKKDNSVCVALNDKVDDKNRNDSIKIRQEAKAIMKEYLALEASEK